MRLGMCALKNIGDSYQYHLLKTTELVQFFVFFFNFTYD